MTEEKSNNEKPRKTIDNSSHSYSEIPELQLIKKRMDASGNYLEDVTIISKSWSVDEAAQGFQFLLDKLKEIEKR